MSNSHPKKSFAKIASLVLLGSSGLFVSNPVQAGPSDAYKKQENSCWNNPDFVSQDASTSRYCIKTDGVIQKVDINTDTEQAIGRIDTSKSIRESRGLFQRAKTSLLEFKIEEDELIKYSCSSKKINSKNECDGKVERSIKGIRPELYYFNKGLKKEEEKEWKPAIENYSKEIKISKSPKAYYHRAFSKYQLSDYKGTLEDLRFSTKDKENLIKILDLRSKANYKLENYKGAVNDITKVIKLRDQKANSSSIEEKEDDTQYKNLYFRRAEYKSELGDTDGAVKDFTKQIEINPLDGQSYFQRGLEKYWSNKKSACKDMLKGLTLGAKDNSYQLINNEANTDSFLEELFDKEKTLVGTCKEIIDTKSDRNQERYEMEKLKGEGIELIKKYALLIPILLIVIVSIVVKFNRNEDDS